MQVTLTDPKKGRMSISGDWGRGKATPDTPGTAAQGWSGAGDTWADLGRAELGGKHTVNTCLL